MSYFFTSESVSEGHPDKLADQISDSILDNFLAFDPKSKVACETLVTTGKSIIAGEVKSNVNIDVEKIVRETINKVGYTKEEYKFTGNTCDVNNFLHQQSEDINRGVERLINEDQGAGDQGIMFGYATDETENFIPLALDLSHKILIELSILRKQSSQIKYLRPDSKSQVTIQYDENGVPMNIDTIVVSTQHDPFEKDDDKMLDKINDDIKNILIPRIREKESSRVKSLFNNEITYHINPTGRFVIGGPHGDAGLTGRKIVVDTYGGKGAHGGGAFSGKDPSKVDRSAAYAARHIAKNLVAAGIAKEILVQVSYAIGVSIPTSININSFGTSKINLSDSEIAQKILKIFDMRPYSIEKRLKLRNPIYFETASYGHMGRKPMKILKSFKLPNGEKYEKEVELFTWEKLDYVEQIRKEFY
ncbi:MAG: methionine adenosyltransferase [Flavobacteriaceae bacterium]|mgnify:FL=1|nr:methionine adenosyltransferase [Flavobacteriaceae bacterium]|tara:strand:- start:2675 stop:3928 length:1254 start_codon:yes stop_codon:yes gene_type:complete